jgi:mannose-6-phosphate isomerase-like protein (cupin superfamily)
MSGLALVPHDDAPAVGVMPAVDVSAEVDVAPASTFPGGTSVTFLDVYDDPAPDGLCGGSPHMHLASTECYIVLSGEGALHTVDDGQVREHNLREGSVIWFTAGTIHRVVNRTDLRILVLMDNGGLSEAGDAVMTFPADIVDDPQRYHAAATLREGTPMERAVAAGRRRDLAVEGYLRIRRAAQRGDFGPLRRFQQAAATLVQGTVPAWADIVERGPAAQAAVTMDITRRLASGSAAHLASSVTRRAPEPHGEGTFGMCGRLRAYDVRKS